VDTTDDALTDVSITGNTATGNSDFCQITSGRSAQVRFDVSSNPLINNTNSGIIVSQLTNSSSAGTLTGTISNNPDITVPPPIMVPTEGTGWGIRVHHSGFGDATVAVTDNAITYGGIQSGIQCWTRNGQYATLAATLTGNTVNLINSSSRHGIELIGGGVYPDDYQTFCVDIRNNTAAGADPFLADISLWQRFSSTYGTNPFRLDGLYYPGDIAHLVEIFVSEQGNSGVIEVKEMEPWTVVSYTAADCAQP
jgi:hypothetical protein